MKNNNLSIARMARLMARSLARARTLGRFFPKGTQKP